MLLTWVLFRASDLASARVILASMLSPSGAPFLGPQLAQALPGVLLVAAIELRKEPATFIDWFATLSPFRRALLLLSLLATGLAFISKQGADFIYFQF